MAKRRSCWNWTLIFFNEDQVIEDSRELNRNEEENKTSQISTKDHIKQMLRILAIEKKKREFTKWNSTEEWNNQTQQIITL